MAARSSGACPIGRPRLRIRRSHLSPAAPYSRVPHGSGPMDPAAAAERLGHSDGGALFLRRYRHLYEAEKRLQARRLESFVREHLDASWIDDSEELEEALSEAVAESGRTWDRTRDLPRVKRALSR